MSENFSDKMFSGNKIFCRVAKEALRDPARVAQQVISYKSKEKHYELKGYMDMLPYIEEGLRPRHFAIAVSPTYYWVIFPNHILKYHLGNKSGIRDAKLYGKAMGVNMESLLDSLGRLNEFKKAVY